MTGASDEPERLTVGEAMQELRQALGLTQDDLAKRVFASRSLIAQLETGRLKLSNQHFRDIAGVLVDEFRGGRPSKLPAGAALAADVLSAVARGEAGTEAETRAGALMAWRETTSALQRLTAQWTSGDSTVSPEVVLPIAGLCLLFPDIEADLLVQLMTWKERDRKQEAFRLALDSHLLFGAFLAHLTLKQFNHSAHLLPELISAAVASRANPPERLDRLRLIAALAPETLGGVDAAGIQAFRGFIAEAIGVDNGPPVRDRG